MTDAIRLQKYFSDCGVLSRRAAEAEISAGHVSVNGIPATLGDRVTPGVDRVEWNGRPVLPRADKPYRYILLNKPRGWVCTAKDEKGRRCVVDLVRIPGVRLYGDFTAPRAPIVSLNLAGEDSARVADALWEEYGICVRAGAHCAPLMHKALGTVEQGVVRFSFSHTNTREEALAAARAVRSLAEE